MRARKLASFRDRELVSVLGEQRVSDPEDDRAGTASSRAIALPAYLVLHAGLAQSRTRLAGLFWPESSEQQARTNLRRELHNLRGLLGSGGAPTADGPTLTWTDSPSCRVDDDTFRSERAAALAALADSDSSTTCWASNLPRHPGTNASGRRCPP